MRRRSSYGRAKRRRRFWASSGVLAVIALVVVGGVAILQGRDLAGFLVGRVFDRAGIALPRLEIRSVGLSGMKLGPVALGEGGQLSASSVAIDWTLWSLMHRRVARVSIDGLRLKLVWDQGGIAVEGLPRGETSAAGFAPPIETLALTNAHITLTAPAAEVAATLSATLAQGEDETLVGEARFDSVFTPSGGAAVHVVGNLPEWRVGRTGLHLAGGELTIPERGTQMSGLVLDAPVASGAGPLNISAKLSGELSDQSKPAAWKPLAFAFDAHGSETGLVLTGSAKTADDALVLTVDGHHDFTRGDGSLTIHSNQLRFSGNGRQPADLFPILGNFVKRFDGTLAANATWSWRNGRPITSALALTLDGVGFEAGAGTIADLRGEVMLDSILPIHTPESQCLTGSLQFGALPSGPLDLCFRLNGSDRLLIDRLALGFADGKLLLSDVSFVPAAPLDAVLKVQDVDLGALLALLNIDGLSGSGMLSGNIPLHLDPSGVAIVAGRLAAAGTGVLRYVGASRPADLGVGQGSAADTVNLVRDALTDFHYTSLSLILDRAADGHGSLLARIQGANPAVLEGRPFVLNIRFESDFDRLAALLIGGYAAGEELLRRAAGQ